MSKLRILIMFSIVMMSAACSLMSQSLQQTQAPFSTKTVPETGTTPTQIKATLIPSATNEPAKIPTEIPTTATATLDPQSATLDAEMGSMGNLMNISQYFHPVGTPLPVWNTIPIMSQATAGQEYDANIYSYLATATLEQALQFYQSKAATLGITNPPATGSAGAGSQANHSITLFSYSLTIVLTSFDNDTGHVIVVISRFP